MRRATGTTPPTLAVGLGLVLLAGGMAVLVHLHPEKLRVPAWVADVALAAFALAGACITAQAAGRPGIARGIACALLGVMTLVPAWIAIGPGPRHCTSITFATRTAMSGATCRGAFGIAAVLLALMFLMALRGALQPTREG